MYRRLILIFSCLILLVGCNKEIPDNIELTNSQKDSLGIEDNEPELPTREELAKLMYKFNCDFNSDVLLDKYKDIDDKNKEEYQKCYSNMKRFYENTVSTIPKEELTDKNKEWIGHIEDIITDNYDNYLERFTDLYDIDKDELITAQLSVFMATGSYMIDFRRIEDVSILDITDELRDMAEKLELLFGTTAKENKKNIDKIIDNYNKDVIKKIDGKCFMGRVRSGFIEYFRQSIMGEKR